jgi:hypothetical protein
MQLLDAWLAVVCLSYISIKFNCLCQPHSCSMTHINPGECAERASSCLPSGNLLYEHQIVRGLRAKGARVSIHTPMHTTLSSCCLCCTLRAAMCLTNRLTPRYLRVAHSSTLTHACLDLCAANCLIDRPAMRQSTWRLTRATAWSTESAIPKYIGTSLICLSVLQSVCCNVQTNRVALSQSTWKPTTPLCFTCVLLFAVFLSCVARLTLSPSTWRQTRATAQTYVTSTSATSCAASLSQVGGQAQAPTLYDSRLQGSSN